jgi:hypothetical protein
MVNIKLAHPLTSRDAVRLRAEEIKEYWTGDVISVPTEEGRAIIQAGYAWHVDPENYEAVAGTLGEIEPQKPKKAKS